MMLNFHKNTKMGKLQRNKKNANAYNEVHVNTYNFSLNNYKDCFYLLFNILSFSLEYSNASSMKPVFTLFTANVEPGEN